MSPDSLPRPIRIAIRREMGIVNTRKEGIRRIISRAMSAKEIPLLIIRSISCRILPIRRTKVSTRRIVQKGTAISFRI